MRKKDLKAGVVYLYDGSGGANILFTVKEDKSFDYQGSIVLHWSGNRVNIQEEPNGFGINEHHLNKLTVSPKKGAEYYNKCAKAGMDVGGYSWHDSNDEKIR